MVRQLLTACLLVLMCTAAPAQPGAPAGADVLQKVRALYEEKSYKLASDTADQASTPTMTADARRELQYLKAISLQALNPYAGDARKLLEDLTSGNKHDVWAGRAHWHLQQGLDQHTWVNANDKEPLAHLRAADRILTDLKPDDLDDFYMAVINSRLITMHFPEKSQQDYLLSYFDKIIPLLKGQEEMVANVQLRRQDVMNIQNPDRSPKEQLAGLRGIVAEFPRTRAAAQAQWKVAQYYIQRQDFSPALYELSLLTNQFAGSDEARNAVDEIERIKRPEANFALASQYLPDENITFTLQGRNTDSVEISAVPFDLVGELKKQKGTQPDLSAATGKPAYKERFKLDDAGDYRATSRSVTLDFKKPGVYVLQAKAGEKVSCQRLLVISNLALVGNMGPTGYEFWTTDLKSGKRRPGVGITIAHDIKTEQRWLTGKQISFYNQFATVQTDANGFADFKPALNGNAFAVAKDGENVAFMQDVSWYAYDRSGEQQQPMAYIYTDRPVYRPEQSVYWRAIVRVGSNGEYQAPKGMLRISIRDPQGQEVWLKEDARLSEFGTVDGELKLASGAPLGQYSISIEDAANRQGFGGGNFRVEEYKKPEFEVSVESASDFAKVGDKVKARVEAKYLFGGAVSEGTVKFTVRRRPRWQIMWDMLPWHLDNSDLGWFDQPQERPGIMHGSGGVIVAQGEGKLQPDGTYEVTFDSTVPDDELKNAQNQGLRSRLAFIWPPPSPAAWDFQVEVTVTDASRRNIDASQVIPVGLKALKLAAKTDRHIVTPGDNARVELKSLNLADKPVPTSGTLYVEKLIWNEKAKENDITTVSEQAVTVDTSGSLIVNWRVPADVHGQMRFAYIVDDPFGGKAVAYAGFYAASPDDTDVNVQYQGVEIVADKTRYTVGENARIMILSEYPDAEAWYWEDVGSGNLHKQVLKLRNRTSFVTIPITDAYVPNSMIHIVAVRDKRLIVDQVELVVPPTKKVLNVEVVPGSDKVEPGTTDTVSLHVTDSAGQPVATELSLSVFDDAISYIAPDMREDVRRFFYGTRRPLRSQVQGSLESALRYGGFILPGGPMYLGAQENYFAFDNRMAFRKAGLRGNLEATMALGVASDAAIPAAAPAPMFAQEAPARELKSRSAEADKAAPMPAIRADFRDSMFWSPTVRTDASGNATVDFRYPDSLTTWRMVAVGVGENTTVGNATTETIARKSIMARLQTPRFFRERDEVTVSANLNNNTAEDVELKTTLRVKGVELDGATTMPLQGDEEFAGNTQTIHVKAGGQARADWTVRVPSAAAGNAIINVVATSAAGGDAMQTTVPLLAHGIDKFLAWNGSSNDEPTTGLTVETSGTAKVFTQQVKLPAERIRETSRLEIRINPSLAASIRDALPYMIDYPYGCVEQTMSRFMPAVVASRAFQTLGYPLEQTLQERLPKVTADSLNRLKDMQLPSGGWGWWAGDSENLQMTAYVAYGLTLARQAEVSVDPALFESAVRRLAELRDKTTSESLKEDRNGWWYSSNLHTLMYAEFILTLNGRSSSETLALLWDRRDELHARGLAMLARTMAKLGRKQEAEVALRNLANVAVPQPENNTMRWGLTDSWWWYEDAVESTAEGLMAYLEIKPDDPAVDQAVKWLVLNRQGNRWKSTRDTAQGVLALSQYLLQRMEMVRPVSVDISAGGKLIKSVEITPQNFWTAGETIVLRGDEIPGDEFPVTFAVRGEGRIYYSIFAEYFTLEENIGKAGNEIYVTRTYERLEQEQTTETVKGRDSAIFKEKWVPLKEGEDLKSGDELRVTLKIKSLNDYEYLVFEDPKPAGTEPVDLQSGSRYGDGLCSNMELRDQWVAFFITNLRQGEHSIQYRVRAEIPGTFHVMPATGKAMYFPPLRANSDEKIMQVAP